MDQKLRVGILGATGMVGQRFISLLENHPWFEVVTVAASPRSAGKTYEEAVGGRWKMTTPMPESVKKLVVMNVNEIEKVAESVDFCFSAVDMSKEEIKAIEEAYAKTETPVVSNNSAHRWTPDVPMVIPEINPEHFDVIAYQKKTARHDERIYRGEAELLDSELCAVPGSMEGIRSKRSDCDDVSGDFRSRQDISGLAGDGGKHHSVYRRRGRKERAGAAARSRKSGGRRDQKSGHAENFLPVYPRSGVKRSHGGPSL